MIYDNTKTATNRKPSLGDLVVCRITGFTGIVTAHAQHLAGCDRLWVEPKVGPDNKPQEGKWMDIDMLSVDIPNVVDRVAYAVPVYRPGGTDLPSSR